MKANITRTYVPLLVVLTFSLGLLSTEGPRSQAYGQVQIQIQDSDPNSSPPGPEVIGITDVPPEPVDSSAPIYQGPVQAPVNGYATSVPSENDPATSGALGYSLTRPFGPLFRVDRRSGDGPAFDSNYTNVNLFVPMHLDPGRNMLFWNLHASMTDDSDWFGNLGMGYRWYSEQLNRIQGLSWWLDVDNHAETYYRAGFSYESLGQYLDLRANVSHVIGRDDALLQSNFTNLNQFTGNIINLTRFDRRETAYSTADFEVGGPVPFLGQYGFNAYGGAYWHRASTDGTVGVKARLQALVTENVALGLTYTHDNEFDTNVFLSAEFTFPSGLIPKQVFRAKDVKMRMADSVQRWWRIPTRIDEATFTQGAINAADGQPFFVVHIDPDAPNGPLSGDGTWENPFGSMQAFLNAGNNPNTDIIHVHGRADGTGTNLDMNSTLALFANQRLLSETVAHTFDTTFGTFNLPGMVTGIANPLLTNNVGGNVILANNNTEISGFRIDGSGGGAPSGSAIRGIGLTGINVNRNTLQNANFGLNLTNVAGLAANGTQIQVNDNTFDGNVIDGFRLFQTNQAPVDLALINNNILNTGTTTGGNGVHIRADNSVVNADDPTGVVPTGILNNTITGNGRGMLIDARNGGRFNGAVEGNTISNNTNDGATFVARNQSAGGTNSLINIESFRNNIVNGNTGNGVVFQAGDGAFANPGGRVLLNDPNNPNANNAVEGNTFDGNRFSGLVLNTQVPNARIDAQIGAAGDTPNVFTNNDTGIELFNRGIMNATIANNDIGTAGNGNTNFGINMQNEDGPQFNVLIGGPNNADANRIVENRFGINGVFNSPTGAGDNPNLTIQGNVVQDSTNTGINLVSNNTVNGNFLIDDNIVTGNGSSGTGNGVHLQGNFTTTSLFTVTNNILSNTGGGSGLQIDANEDSNFTVNVGLNTIDGNNADGVSAFIEDNATPTILIGGAAGQNVITNNGDFGVDIQQGLTRPTVNTANPTVTVNNNLITDNTNGGVRYAATGIVNTIPIVPGTATVNISNNDILRNGAVGVELTINGAHGTRANPTDITVDGNVIDTHTEDGIRLITDADFHQQRLVVLFNDPLIDIDPGPGVTLADPPSSAFPRDPDEPEFLALTDYRENYLNLRTASNTSLTVTNNSISNSGDHGHEIQVGTGTYVAADVQNNTFANNSTADFATGSFLSDVPTNTSVDRRIDTPGNNTDSVFLDDTAQLDLRFEGNSGRTIDVTGAALGNAIYTNNDAGKDFSVLFGNGAGGQRRAFLFQIDNSPTLTSSNPFIQAPGLAQDIDAAFTSGGYFLSPIADPLFADPNFPQNLPNLFSINNLPGLP